ncbi:MAG: hypothetical protein HN900_20825 [Gammaproteobacteria bacterium]|jgi:hypothetical protein|nr:hypothetical protein [Gammaproteobacteria bacterium]MBT3868285.1 hypothetical protein [Gammaproteobacteria bacterium]MBT5196564.1 hypothetical protein [Gammaproteobacteria bacterium]MBT5444247.1 hypothetical protein [Gammaproteobacteria bacterium]MBT5791867.1 hypothetical protein [Gammaproteobacteria bacterium]
MPDWQIDVAREQLPTTEPAFNEWPQKSGGYHPEFYRLDDCFLIRFLGLADFFVSQNADKINTRPAPGIAPELVEEVYQNLVLPLALSQQRQLVFHASAVEIDQCSVVFMADSGTGKSTLAADFATNGYRFLADDCVWLNKQPSGFHVMPGHPSLRIWEDTFETLKLSFSDIGATKNSIGKWQLGSSQADSHSQFHCAVARPLKHVYFLEKNPADEIEIKSVTTQEAVVGLLSHRFLLDVTNKAILSNDIKSISALASASACFRLCVPNNFDALPDIRSRIVAHTNGKPL